MISSQYDSVASFYSRIFLIHNQDSITAYLSHLNIPVSGKRVLDLGCGDGFDLLQLKQRGAILYGIDASEEMIKLAKKRNPEADIRFGTFDNCPFRNHSFDVVMSKWSFQNAMAIDPIYHEVARILKPGGSFIFLASHPIRQFLEKKKKNKDYFQKEMVESVFFDEQLQETAPSHTLNEYLSPTFFKYFVLESFFEGNDRGAERVDGDIFPSFFILKSHRKKM